MTFEEKNNDGRLISLGKYKSNYVINLSSTEGKKKAIWYADDKPDALKADGFCGGGGFG